MPETGPTAFKLRPEYLLRTENKTGAASREKPHKTKCRKGRIMKLEDLLEKGLYEQVKTAIDVANAKEPDKLKHIRYADLSEGNYISKEKYTELETDHGSMAEQLKTAQNLIAELKKEVGDGSGKLYQQQLPEPRNEADGPCDRRSDTGVQPLFQERRYGPDLTVESERWPV